MMKQSFTEEQILIINSEGNVAINAVAGSGKTTTVIEYAATRPPGSKILYLAFNKSVKLEALRKFQQRGLHNVTVETAHSLAYRHIMRENVFKVRANGYKTYEIADLLDIRVGGEKHAEYIIANHINKFSTYFCNSNTARVQDLDYINTISDPKAKRFVRSFYNHILDGTRRLLAKMDKAEIEITHDFYLKKFQLSEPVLSFDYILFDEGQDASAAMLDIFLKQKAIKIIVGDAHQQIYSWRYAINSLAQTDFNTLDLSASFRFPQDIADLAVSILSWKKQLGEFRQVKISGKGSPSEKVNSATLARTNLGLLLNAINYITDNPGVKHQYFEGNINSYTYADDGASLYDILSLYNSNHDRIRDKLIRSMKSMWELEEYVKSTEDAQLGMMIEIVNEYGNEIPGLLKKLKDLHTGDEDRNKAEMIFSTVHRAKGMEYDEVHLVNDFISEQKLERTISESKKDKEKFPLDINKLNEEINLLYVAITRAKNKLCIPAALLPDNFISSPHVQVMNSNLLSLKTKFSENGYDRASVFGKKDFSNRLTGRQIKEKAYSVDKIRSIHSGAYKPWTPEQDKELVELFEGSKSISELADHFGRTKGSIISRLKKLSYFPE